MCLRCVVLAGTSEGTSESKEFYCELVVGVAAPSDPMRSFIVKILHSVEGGNVE